MKPKPTGIQSPLFICLALTATVPFSNAATWSTPLTGGSYVWNTSGANWDTNPSYPTGADSAAIFNSNFTGTITMTGDNTLGSISYTDTGSSNNDFRLSSGKLTFDTTVGTPTISYLNGTGAGILWLGNAGPFEISGNDGLTIDGGNSSQAVRISAMSWTNFTGALTLTRGSFQPQAANVLPQAAGSKVVLGSGSNVATLSLFSNTRNQSIVGLDGNSLGSVNNGSNATTGTLTLGTNSISTESFNFQGQIGSTAATNDNIAVTKTGAGTQTLSGNNLYTGTTTVSGGTLKLGSSTALGSTTGITMVASSAALDLNGQTVAENFGDTSSIDGFSGQGLGNTGALINSSGTTATISGNIYTNASGGLTGLGVANTNGFVIGSGNITLNGEVGRRNSGISSMAIVKSGTGTLTFGGTVSNGTFGDLYVNSGTVTLAKTGNAVAVSNVTINGGTLKMDSTKTTSPTNVWQGQVGNGVTFGASGGTWDLNDTAGNNNRLKGVSGTTGSITNTGTGAALLKFAMRDNSAFWSFSGTIIDGTGTVAVETANGGFGTGQVQVLGGNNSYSGGTAHNYGTLRMGHNNALGTGTVASTSTLDLNGYTLANALTSPGNGAVFTNGGATTATVSTGFNAAGTASVVISDFTVNGTADINWSGAIRRTSFTGTVTKNGTNTLTLSGAGTGYAGMTYTVSGGTLSFNMPNGSQFNSGTITSSTSVVGAQGTGVTNTIGSAINGTGSFTQSGAGTTILSAANGYTGATLVSNGTLVVNGSLANTTTTIAGGAVLAGNGSIAGATTISGSLRPGNSIGTMTIGNDVTWNSSDAWVFELGSAASTLALAGSGTSIQDMLNITGGNDFIRGTGADGSFVFDFAGTGAAGYYRLVDWDGTTAFTSAAFSASNLSSGLSGTFIVDSGTSALYLNVVPEPGAALTGGIGLLLLLRRRR